MTQQTPEQSSYDEAKSIVDTVLDLDAFLSGDIRRAEDIFTFCTEPDLEARIDELNLALARVEGAVVTPKTPAAGEEPLAAAATSAGANEDERVRIIREIFDLERTFASKFRSIKLLQMDPDDFRAFQLKWKEEIAKGNLVEQDPEMLVELIVATASAPKMTPVQVAAFRKRVSETNYHRLASACWNLNKQQGVSVPKSSLSSADLKLAGLERS